MLGGTLTMMGALIILLAGFNLLSAIRHDRAAQRVVDLATIDGHVFDALLAMRFEHTTMQGPLLTAGPVDDEMIARITGYRKRSQAGYGQAAPLLAMAATATPDLAAAFATLSATRQAMDTLRPQADAMFRQPRSARAVQAKVAAAA